MMIVEASMVTLMKGTLTGGASAWTIALLEGRWLIALAAVPPLILCGFNLRHYSRRGKRAEGPP